MEREPYGTIPFWAGVRFTRLTCCDDPCADEQLTISPEKWISPFKNGSGSRTNSSCLESTPKVQEKALQRTSNFCSTVCPQQRQMPYDPEPSASSPETCKTIESSFLGQSANLVGSRIRGAYSPPKRRPSFGNSSIKLKRAACAACDAQSSASRNPWPVGTLYNRIHSPRRSHKVALRFPVPACSDENRRRCGACRLRSYWTGCNYRGRGKAGACHGHGSRRKTEFTNSHRNRAQPRYPTVPDIV